MSEARPITVETLARSNEKLLKAEITLLSLKDPHLLEELGAIFEMAGSTNPAIGAGDQKVFTEVKRELKLVEALVQRLNLMDEDDLDVGGRA